MHDPIITFQNLNFKGSTTEISAAIFPNKIYKISNSDKGFIQSLNYYLSGLIRNPRGFSKAFNYFAYQSDLNWIYFEKDIEDIASWLLLQKEPIDKFSGLFKMDVLKELAIAADIYQKPFRLSKNNLLSFIVSSFLFQAAGVILIAELDLAEFTATQNKYFNQFINNSNCAIILANDFKYDTSKEIVIIA